MSSEGQKFSKNRRFLPTGERKFPKNGQFYASRRTKIFRESPFFANRRTKISQKRPFLCQPKEKNFARKAIFVPAERRKFPRNSQFYASRRTKISRERPFFANRRTRISRKRPVLRQPEDEKNESNDHFPSPGWEIPTKIPPPKGRKSEKNSGKTGNGATCPQTEPGFFHAARQMTSRKSRTAGTFLHRTARIFYVSLPENVRSTRWKPTVPGRKTYGLHTGNIENIKEKRGYPADIFRIRNTGKNKRTVYRKRTEKPHTEKQGKQSEGKLTENQEDKSGLKTEDLTYGHKKRSSAELQPLLTLNLIL